MKSWFGKLIRADKEMDRALRQRPVLPKPAADSDLHDSIMRAVRQEAAAQSRRDGRAARGARVGAGEGAWMRGMRWLIPMGVTAAVAGVVGVMMLRQADRTVTAIPGQIAVVMAPDSGSEKQQLAGAAGAAGAALDLGAKMPAMMMEPLSNELAHVDRDLHRTTEVLLASFP